MLMGIIIGVIIVIIASVVGEVRVIKERQKQGMLLEKMSIKGKEHQRLKDNHAEALKIMKDLIDASDELTHDYMIVAGILEKELGEEETLRRFEEKKNEEPKDINDLIADIKARKGE